MGPNMTVLKPMIPILRPRLPTADRIAPYLQKIDATRSYSNFGPLVLALEERLATQFGFSTGTVTTVGNATLGLALALAAQSPAPGSLCAMPAWTFIASPHAAVVAGLTPYFVDVDARTWALDPSTVEAALAGAPAQVGAVMPVAPFGYPLDVAAWDRFRKRTGLPVVIDAAAGFDALVPGATPAVVSLHATKVLGIGEGGFIISTDVNLIADIRRRSNFGLNSNRQSIAPATNAKLSEYHAAIGHAALDQWREARAEWMAVGAAYRQRFGQSNHIHLQESFGETWVAGTCLVQVREQASILAQQALTAAGIETRDWWGKGAHSHPAAAEFPRSSLTVTAALSRSTFAVPFYRDLAITDVNKIADILLATTSV
jgi:dTDP-4-amino-4,6-dideoxygalactose transaminase